MAARALGAQARSQDGFAGSKGGEPSNKSEKWVVNSKCLKISQLKVKVNLKVTSWLQLGQRGPLGWWHNSVKEAGGKAFVVQSRAPLVTIHLRAALEEAGIRVWDGRGL